MNELTKETILVMEAGRKTDALMAELVMGWSEISPVTFTGYKPDYAGEKRRAGWPPRLSCFPVPNYSTDILAVWEIVKQVVPEDEDETWMEFHLDWEPGLYCYACFTRREHDYRHGGSNPIAEFVGESVGNPALAVCRAALLTTLERR